MGFMLAPIQSRVTIPLFCPASPFEGRSSFSLARSLVLNRSLRWCSASPLTPSPPLPRTLSSFAAPSSIYREEVSHTTDSRQFSHLESQNFSLPRLPSSLFPSVPTSLSPFISGLPLSSLASFGVSRTPPRYIRVFPCISFQLVSSHTHLLSFSFSFSTFSFSLFLLLPLVPREHVREVRFPLASLSLPPRQPVHSFSSFFLPRSVSPPVPGGYTLPHPVRRASPPSSLRSLRGCSPFCIAQLPLTSSSSLTPAPVATPSGSILVPLPLVRPRFLALSDARSSRSRLREAQGEKGVRFYKWFQPRTGAGVVFRVIGRRLCHAAAER